MSRKDESRTLDIFDKIMKLPVFRWFEPIYIKYKETLIYLFFGGVSFLLNIIMFIVIDKYLHINELINNIICWISCVLFQFFTNRTWVFDGHVNTRREFIKQMCSFFSGRLFTLAIEEIILVIFIKLLGLNAIAVKLVAQIVVIILNYIISKKIIFR